MNVSPSVNTLRRAKANRKSVSAHWVNRFPPPLSSLPGLFSYSSGNNSLRARDCNTQWFPSDSSPGGLTRALCGNSRSSAWQVSRVTPDSSTGMSLTSTCSSPTEMFSLICGHHGEPTAQQQQHHNSSEDLPASLASFCACAAAAAAQPGVLLLNRELTCK